MSGETELPQLRFIPFRRADIVQMCLSDERLDAVGKDRFIRTSELIETHYQKEFHSLRNGLKDAYALIDPDSDTRLLPAFAQPQTTAEIVPLLEQVLERGNYERVTDEALKRAMNTSSLFQLRLHVDMGEFDEVLLYTRGASARNEVIREFFGLWKRNVRFTNFDRVVLFIRFKENVDSDSALGECPPGSTMLKLFQNVPEADIEMLFPNIRLGMRLLDKLIIGVPAVISGTIVVTTRLGATVLLLGSLLGFWLGMSTEPVKIDNAALIALGASIAALAGYVWKQFSNFRNRKLKYTQALTENLYFKLLDNNAGVIHRVVDDAEESECKESMLAYYFLLVAQGPLSSEELDGRIESWMAERWHCKLDFEIGDALNKLDQLGLACESAGEWSLADPGA